MLDGADFCEKCGGKLDPEDDICPSCGARAGGLEQEHKKKEDKEKLREFLAEDTETPILEEVEKRNPLLSIGLILLGLVIVGVMIGGLIYQKNNASGRVPIKVEDLTTKIVGSWQTTDRDMTSPKVIEFYPDGKYRITEEKSSSILTGTYRFPRLNEIEMTATGRSHGVYTVTLHWGDLVLITPQSRTVTRYKRVSTSAASPGASTQPPPGAALVDPVGRWKVIKVDVQGKADGHKGFWERVMVEIIKTEDGRFLWRNLDSATGQLPALPPGAPKITTYLELEMKEGLQRDGMITNVLDGGPRNGVKQRQIPVKAVMEKDMQNLTIHMIWPGEVMITLFTKRQ